MLAALSASGESDRAFAERTGVPPHRIYYWRKKLAGATPGRGEDERTVAGFVPVRVVEEQPAPAPGPGRNGARQVEAMLPGGARLVFHGAWDRTALSPWLAALGAADAQ